MGNDLRVLYVVNKKLPPNDYRIRYGKISKKCNIVYGMPAKTNSLSDVSYVYMGFEEGWRFTYFLLFFRLYLFLRSHRDEFDVVHFFSTNLTLCGPIVAYLAGVQSLVTLTGFGRVFTSTRFIYKLLRPIYKFFLGFSIRLSQRYLFQNQADLYLLSSKYPKQAKKFIYIGSAVDFPQAKQKDFLVRKLIVILVTRLLPDKGIYDFIHVAEELSRDSWEFVLIGPPSVGFNKLYKTVVDYNNRGIITYRGECLSEDVKSELTRAHIFYFPSYGEGLSRTMLEAGFSLLCPVAYDIPSNKDLIAAGRGFLLPAGDVKSAISILNLLLNDRTILANNAHSYQDFIIQNYNIKTYSDRMDAILTQIFHSRG